MIPGLPAGPRRKAFREFVRVVRDAPAFRNRKTVATWMVGDSSTPGCEPTVDAMPCVQLRLVGGPIERLATIDDSAGVMPTVDIRCRPMIVVETWVKGGNIDDAMDLFDAIDDALFPADPARRAAIRDAFRAVGISDWMPTRDVLPESLADYGGAWVRSVGMYEITLDLTQ